MKWRWDAKKAAANLKSHGVSFEEAETLFGDPLARTKPDYEHSRHEQRFLTMGMTDHGRLLVVSHTNERIISARKPIRRERKAYEESCW
jgi:hypothetical protein